MLLRCNVGIYSGEIRDYPTHIGKVLLADGRASLVREDEDVETATAEPAPERAVRRRGRPRGSRNKSKLIGVANDG